MNIEQLPIRLYESYEQSFRILKEINLPTLDISKSAAKCYVVQTRPPIEGLASCDSLFFFFFFKENISFTF